MASSLNYRLTDDSSECNFLDNRCEWPIKSCDLSARVPNRRGGSDSNDRPPLPIRGSAYGADPVQEKIARIHCDKYHNGVVTNITTAAIVDDPQELLNIARHHCQAIQTIIDQLTEIKSNTELRLLSQDFSA